MWADCREEKPSLHSLESEAAAAGSSVGERDPRGKVSSSSVRSSVLSQSVRSPSPPGRAQRHLLLLLREVGAAAGERHPDEALVQLRWGK